MLPYPISIYEQNRVIQISNETEFNRFLQDYTFIHAAGGIVRHVTNRILMICRHNLWDFPKGKVENGESYAAAAIREVQEETGITELQLRTALPSTFHTYVLNEKPVLKETHWFAMTSACTRLIPQTAEDITRAKWIPLEQVDNLLQHSYLSLLDLWHNVWQHYA